MSGNNWPLTRKGVNQNAQQQEMIRQQQQLARQQQEAVRRQQEIVQRQQQAERKLTAATVRWPFLDNGTCSSASDPPLRRSDAIRKQNVVNTANPGKPRRVDNSAYSPTGREYGREKNDTSALRRSDTIANSGEHPLTYDGLVIRAPIARHDKLARDPPRALARLGPCRSDGLLNDECASWLPNDEADTSITEMLRFMSPQNRYRILARPSVTEPAPQNVINDLRNLWQGIQRPIKAHNLPPE
ncbi:hypothetical protein K449DRAFT_431533 [Hypoxylon sp. EC38]|nr:hypothetical protein K449DRAFT_431533 [Hypoxylon sp. EC38]